MNGFDLSTISGIFVGGNKYHTIYKGSTLIFRDYSAEYLTIESLEDDNIIGWKMYNNSATPKTIEYSTDTINWTSIVPEADADGATIATLNTGDKLYIRGDNETYCTFPSNTNLNHRFTSTKTYNVYGNIMSLISSTNFKTLDTFTAGRTFYGLFMNSSVVDASNLILPVKTINQQLTYGSMFESCTSLIAVPKLPATTLNTYCYYWMFKGCTSLTTIPSDLLPATTLANYCYTGMFRGCTNLTTLPKLQATTLANNCYQYMFTSCTSLTTIPSDLLPATTLANYCYDNMFYDCKNITTAPDLLATTLAPQCYRYMFDSCISLNYVKMLATDISATNCLYGWLNRVSASGTFIKDPNMTSLPTGTSGIPSGWTVQDAS